MAARSVRGTTARSAPESVWQEICDRKGWSYQSLTRWSAFPNIRFLHHRGQAQWVVKEVPHTSAEAMRFLASAPKGVQELVLVPESVRALDTGSVPYFFEISPWLPSCVRCAHLIDPRWWADRVVAIHGIRTPWGRGEVEIPQIWPGAGLAEVVFSHGDLSPLNVRAGRIIDFGRSGWAPPEYDLQRLIWQLLILGRLDATTGRLFRQALFRDYTLKARTSLDLDLARGIAGDEVLKTLAWLSDMVTRDDLSAAPRARLASIADRLRTGREPFLNCFGSR